MEQISGERQYDFVSKFQYIREAGTSGELQAAETILAELEAIGVSGRMEEFSFPAFEMEAREFFQRLIDTIKEEKAHGKQGI